MRPVSEAGRRVGGRALLAMVWWIAGTQACGPAEELSEPSFLEQSSQELESVNGLSANGLSANGLSANGLSANGLSANGLATNGLSASSFAAWFGADPANSDMLMRYLVRCAVPAGQTRSYTDPQTGYSYTWTGNLGLAPGWAGGAPATTAEQQTITACLLAHVNRYGQSVPISVQGLDAQGAPIAYSQPELNTYNVREACFFGNLFTNEGLFFGVDRWVSNNDAYLTRACAGISKAKDCAPLRFVGTCWQSCTPELLTPYYSRCTRNGVSYRSINTRMRQQDYQQLFPDGD